MHIKGSDTGGKGATLGLAPVGGICRHKYNCVVGELGVHGKRGQPHPSAGFAAVYVMAHELGHNLGMLHDDKDGCSRDGYIMSPTRGSKGKFVVLICCRFFDISCDFRRDRMVFMQCRVPKKD